MTDINIGVNRSELKFHEDLIEKLYPTWSSKKRGV